MKRLRLRHWAGVLIWFVGFAAVFVAGSLFVMESHETTWLILAVLGSMATLSGGATLMKDDEGL